MGTIKRWQGLKQRLMAQTIDLSQLKTLRSVARTLSSSSRTRAHDVELLLLKFGVCCHIGTLTFQLSWALWQWLQTPFNSISDPMYGYTWSGTFTRHAGLHALLPRQVQRV